MKKVYGVKILNTNKTIYYVSEEFFYVHDYVIVLVNKNTQLGEIIKDCVKIKEERIDQFEEILNKATNQDKEKFERNKEEASRALIDAIKLSQQLNLSMKFLNAYFSFDRSQLLFNFIADDRVDFRELAKKLAQLYKTRIELRQLGVRDKAKSVGGIGPCGLSLCCHTFLKSFDSVSINMAKNQSLSLNPIKINGLCGRLLCCLKYEDDTYTDLKSKMPKVGSSIKTKSGVGQVVSIDIFKNSVKVDIPKKGIVEELVDKL